MLEAMSETTLLTSAMAEASVSEALAEVVLLTEKLFSGVSSAPYVSVGCVTL